jgi:hypothetical protein
MTQALKFLQRGSADDTLYVDDVFSTYLYTGNGSTQTITNNIDLSTNGGMVWVKERSGTYAETRSHMVVDSARGVTVSLQTNSTAANTTQVVTAFNTTGFSLNDDVRVNDNAGTGLYASWTFRKANKFFDVQTATRASGNATVSFTNLTTLGMVIVKRTDSTGDWYVWHKDLTAGKLLYLNQTAAEATLGHITVSGTTLTLVGGTLADGDYVCYGFAHDTGTDGIIQCGSYAGTGVSGLSVTLGWEPQYLLIKNITTAGEAWGIHDSMRGMPTEDASGVTLWANSASAEGASARGVGATATGFKVNSTNPELNASSTTYIYLAIRRPNKPPTSGTEVFSPVGYTGTGVTGLTVNAGMVTDLAIITNRGAGGGYERNVADRLRGASQMLYTRLTNAEATATTRINAFDLMNGVKVGTDSDVNASSGSQIGWLFRRAPGVFDVVCYTGTGSAHTEAHNLQAVPELIIVKKRSGGTLRNWAVYNKDLTTGYALQFNQTAAQFSQTGYWNSTTPSAATFTVGTDGDTNESTATFVAYLFATKAGISKVGSYTGNGSSQTINCGFAAGARFILIKRTDSTGDWFLWDSTRGIVAGNDPHLSLNSTAAEVTTDDSIDPDNSGFIVNQDAATNINVTSATYIFLSFA